MLYNYLVSKYNLNEPIFVSDIELEIPINNLRIMLKSLCDDGLVKTFDDDTYYLPKKSILRNGVPLAADEVAFAKYIKRRGHVIGFYSGYTFANQMGISTQVPFVQEIVSNNAQSVTYEKVMVRNKQIMLKKPVTTINEENSTILQLLYLLESLKLYYDIEFCFVAKRIRKYINDENITRDELDKYIRLFSDDAIRNLELIQTSDD